MYSVWVSSGWPKDYTRSWVEGIEVRGKLCLTWLDGVKGCTTRGYWSWEMQRWNEWTERSGKTWLIRMAVSLYKVWLNAHLIQNHDGVDSNISATAATDSLAQDWQSFCDWCVTAVKFSWTTRPLTNFQILTARGCRCLDFVRSRLSSLNGSAL